MECLKSQGKEGNCMKKRLLALVLGAALALSLLGGCGSGKGDKDSASQETEKESVE